MRLSVLVELIMQFASYEAIAGKFREVEPEHLLMALLKFPELPIGEMEKLAPGQGTKEIAKEVDVVCKELGRRAIESKKVRRELRAKMGRGNSPFSGSRIHRSAASRKIFDVAAKLADEAGSEVVTAEYILEALMIAPTRAIEQVLGDAVGAKVRERNETPLLDKYGRDLTMLAANKDNYPGTDRMVEGKALINILSQPERKSVLLITDDEAAAMRAVIRAAQSIAMKDNCPAVMKGKRIVDVSGLKRSGKRDKKTEDHFEKLYAEATASEDTILFVPAIESAAHEGTFEGWSDLLRQIISRGSVQCICRVGSVAYRDYVKRDTVWKRLANAIWIHDEFKDQVPWEL